MRKAHKIIFVVFLMLACFSAYSLAQMNQVHKINFLWNSEGDSFSESSRNSYGDWTSSGKPEYINFDIVTSPNEMVTLDGASTIKYIDMPDVDFDNDFLIFATLGEVAGRGNTIKVKDMAQRGNIVEIMVDMAQPRDSSSLPFNKDYPYDVIKVPKDQLVFKGDLLFIFKDYKGTELFRKEYNIDKKKDNI